MPPGHPIILVRSDKLNMAAVSVKRSIELKPIMGTLLRRTTDSVDRGSGGRGGGGVEGFAPSQKSPELLCYNGLHIGMTITPKSFQVNFYSKFPEFLVGTITLKLIDDCVFL